MGRPFSAPIRVYNNFGHPRHIDGVTVRAFALAQWRSEPDDFLRTFWSDIAQSEVEDMPPDLSNEILLFAWHSTRSFRLAEAILGIRNVVRLVEDKGDALDVDDRFMALIDPVDAQRSHSEMKSFLEAKLQAGVSRSELGSVLMEVAPCLHSRWPHSLLLEGQRGRKRDSRRRAATWGTYLVSYFVGSDTLAVPLWNRLFMPAAYKWAGPSASPKTARKKYSEAKGKLIRDLEGWCRRRVINQEAQYETFSPLEAVEASYLKRLITLYAQSEERGADLSDFNTRIGYAGRALLFPLPLDLQPEHPDDLVSPSALVGPIRDS